MRGSLLLSSFLPPLSAGDLPLLADMYCRSLSLPSLPPLWGDAGVVDLSLLDLFAAGDTDLSLLDLFAAGEMDLSLLDLSLCGDRPSLLYSLSMWSLPLDLLPLLYLP